MLNQVDLSPALRNKLWTEGAMCANLFENITSSGKQAVTPYELFIGKTSALYDHLKEFGRIAYVTQRTKIKTNWKNRALRWIMMGYADNRPTDTSGSTCQTRLWRQEMSYGET